MIASSTTRRYRRLVGVAVTGLLLISPLAVVTPPAVAGQDKVVDGAFDPRAPRITNGRVYAIDTFGDLAVVGGSFNEYREGDGSGPRTQQWVFMFNHRTGKIVPGFNPQLRGPAPVTDGLVDPTPGVQAVRFAPDGGSVYIAGDFTSINGVTARRVAQLKLNGDVVDRFSASTDQVVNDMVLAGNRLIIAGKFAKVNGENISRITSLDPRTGDVQKDFNLQASQSRYEFAPFVQELDLSANGRWLAVSGNFERLGGKVRKQLGLIDLRGTPSVANWATDEYAGDCFSDYDATWIYGLDISPDSRFLIVSTTGSYQGADKLCDTIARLELPAGGAVGGGVPTTWVNHTGGDTLWANEVTESAVYVGGHQRWMNNPNPTDDDPNRDGDADGPGSVSRQGFAALDPLSGVPLSLNPGRDRGRGVEAMHVNGQKLFIGHDTDLFNGAVRQRLAVLDTNGGFSNPQPIDQTLPVNLNVRMGNSLRRIRFDGASLGPATTASGPGVDGVSWNGFRDGFYQRGQVHYFGPQGAFWKRDIDDNTVGSATNLSATVGYVDSNRDLTPFDQPLGVQETQVAGYRAGRIYYRTGLDGRLFSRGYSLQSGIVGASTRRETDESFASARALAFIGDRLYAAWGDGSLYRFDAPGGQVRFTTKTAIDNGASGIDWANVSGLFATPAAGSPAPDRTGPRVNVIAPRAGSTGRSGRTLVRGNAADFNEVAQVRVSVRRTSKPRLWLRAGGRWKPRQAYTRAVLSNPGGSQTNWSLRPKLPTGSYKVLVRAQDATGNLSAVAVRRFKVRLADKKNPATAIKRSPNRATRARATTIVGLARDNQAVARVRIQVQETNKIGGRTKVRWLKPNGRWGNRKRAIDAKTATPLLRKTRWKQRISLSKGRTYRITAWAVDVNNKRDRTRSSTTFRRK